MKLLRFFSRYLRRYVAWGLVAMVAVLAFALTTAAMLALIEPIFSEVLLAGKEDVPGSFGSLLGGGGDEPAAEEGEKTGAEDQPAWDLFDLDGWFDARYQDLKERFGIDEERVVYFVPLLFVLVYAVRSLASFVSGFSFQRIGLGVTRDVRNALYRRILEQSSRFHADHPSGELVSRLVNDVNVMQVAVSNRLLDLVQQSVSLVAMMVMLLSIHLQLALICLVVTPALLFPIIRFGKGIRGTSHRSQERMADLAQLLAEGVRGHRVVKAFGMEDFEYGRFRKATARHLRVNLWAQVLANLSSPVIETLAALGSAALLIYAGNSIRQETLTVAVLVQFLTTLLLMYDPIRKLNKVNLMLQEALAAAHRVADLMAVPNDVREREGARVLETVRESIGFEDVTFGYDRQDVLKNVQLTVRTGEMVALVGPSGAGKSTLVNLLPRFFDPDAGRVTIDGIDVRDLTLKSLRAQIGIVTQETMLFDDTIRNNIAYGRSDLPLEAVQEAAKDAFADEFIDQLPEGYESRVGEAGSRLSGGQRQRLAIARALLKNAPILILDEATSQLDSESEALVQKALHRLMEGRTTLVIAHRLATVMRADRIVVLDGGRIVEEGTHQELLSHAGKYKRLFDLQFRM